MVRERSAKDPSSTAIAVVADERARRRDKNPERARLAVGRKQQRRKLRLVAELRQEHREENRDQILHG